MGELDFNECNTFLITSLILEQIRETAKNGNVFKDFLKIKSYIFMMKKGKKSSYHSEYINLFLV